MAQVLKVGTADGTRIVAFVGSASIVERTRKDGTKVRGLRIGGAVDPTTKVEGANVHDGTKWRASIVLSPEATTAALLAMGGEKALPAWAAEAKARATARQTTTLLLPAATVVGSEHARARAAISDDDRAAALAAALEEDAPEDAPEDAAD